MSDLHVIFGTGPLGKWTARELTGMGHRVKMVNRSGQATDLPAGAEIIQADAYDLEAAVNITKGATSVYQCAQPAYHQWAGNFPRLQASILEATARNGAKLVLAENLYLYGDPNGSALTEQTPMNPNTRKGQVRLEMTRAAFEAHRAGKLRVTAARGSDFFGPDDPIYADLIFKPALSGKTVNLVGSLNQPHTFTYAPDFGRALAILGTREEADGRAWHVPSDAPVTQGELIKLLETALGKPVKAMAGGKLILSVMGLFNPSVREIVEMLYEFTKPFVMDSSAFQKTWNLQPTPLREAVQNTLEWNRAHLATHTPKPAHA
jgi:nucleoside-diphosphate-sugar epimerase